jgi:RNA polymerase sigma factor (sigma-70 family)
VARRAGSRTRPPLALETETGVGHYSPGMDPRTSEEPLLSLTPEVERALVENHQRFLSFLERRLGTRVAAEELLQSALLRAVESGSAPRDSEGAVTWFYRLLRNALVDQLRRQAVEHRAVENLAHEPTPEQPDPELRQAVCACMHGLLPSMKPEYAQMVQGVDLDERPVAEVAAELGVTANNASVRLHRARQALKRQLERACGSCATHGCLDCSCSNRNRGAQV